MIPQQLKEYRNWVVWKLDKVKNQEKLAKMPYQINGDRASTTDSTHWTSYDEAYRTYQNSKGKYLGIGYVFSEADPFTGIDFDGCIKDGVMVPESAAIIKDLNSWTESSQSGEGAHVFIIGKKPGASCKKKMQGFKEIEMYDHGRFFAMTGNQVEGTPDTIQERQDVLNDLYIKVFGKQEEKARTEPIRLSIDMDDQSIVDKCLNAKNGNTFRSLYNGDHGKDHSSSDMALCSMIAFYTQEHDQIDRIFKSSGLYREKWNRQDYKTKTITKAIESLRNTYDQGFKTVKQKPSERKEQPIQSEKPKGSESMFTDTEGEAQEHEQPKQQEAPKQDEKEHYYVSEYLGKFIDDINANKKKKTISTGFLNLNKKMGGGIFPGLYVIGGISSLGKTAFTLQLSDYIASQGLDVIFFSLEMSKLELVSRSISRHLFKANRQKCKDYGTLAISRGNVNDIQSEMHDALRDYKEVAENLVIVEGNFDTSIDTVRKKVEEHIIKTGGTIEKDKNKKIISITGGNIPTVFIDYLQILKGMGTGTDKQETDFIATELKRISRDFDTPVIVVSSFSRANYNNPVGMESFKESGAIEYTADVLIGLQLSVLSDLDLSSEAKRSQAKATINAAKGENPRKVSAVILKQRNAKPHEKQDFLFYPVNNLFTEVL